MTMALVVFLTGTVLLYFLWDHYRTDYTYRREKAIVIITEAIVLYLSRALALIGAVGACLDIIIMVWI